MEGFPLHLYLREGLNRGLSESELRKTAAEIVRQRSLGIRPIVSTAHLAEILQLPASFVRAIVDRRENVYHSFEVPKRTGGLRRIDAPLEPLLAVQRWILDHALAPLQPHPRSFAYENGRSIRHAAEVHVGAAWLLKMDLHDFFGSINERSVYRVFANLGYPSAVALQLARLCTVSHFAPPTYRSGVRSSYPESGLGVLPQGGPTSGRLANEVARELDGLLDTMAASNAIGYSRYSDDLCFSFGPDANREAVAAIAREVTQTAARAGFAIHHRKTRVISPGARKIVLGLIVGAERPALTPEYKRRIELHLRGVEKFGIMAHSFHRSFQDIASFVRHVDGLISFAAGIEEERARAYRSRWNAALGREGLM